MYDVGPPTLLNWEITKMTNEVATPRGGSRADGPINGYPDCAKCGRTAHPESIYSATSWPAGGCDGYEPQMEDGDVERPGRHDFEVRSDSDCADAAGGGAHERPLDESDPVTLAIIKQLDQSEKVTKGDLERIANTRIVMGEIASHLPHTLGEYFDLTYIYHGFWTPPRADIQVSFTVRDGLHPENVQVAFGTIIKVAGALMRAGYQVEPTPTIEANDARALDVHVSGERGEGEAKTKVTFNFTRLPESDRCKLVEEEVVVPEHKEIKLRVQCDGAPVRLDVNSAPLIPEVVA